MKILSTALTLVAILSAPAVLADEMPSSGSAPDMTGPEITATSQVYTRKNVPSREITGYPERAAQDEVVGGATVEIQIGEDGRPAKCVVISETPPKYDFGRELCFVLLANAHFDMNTIVPGQWLSRSSNFQLGNGGR
jgi:hypothetical protein